MRLLCIPPFVLAGDLTSWGFILAAALCLGLAGHITTGIADAADHHHTHHGGHD